MSAPVQESRAPPVVMGERRGERTREVVVLRKREGRKREEEGEGRRRA